MSKVSLDRIRGCRAAGMSILETASQLHCSVSEVEKAVLSDIRHADAMRREAERKAARRTNPTIRQLREQSRAVTIERIRALLAQGHGKIEIADMLGVKPQSVFQLIKLYCRAAEPPKPKKAVAKAPAVPTAPTPPVRGHWTEELVARAQSDRDAAALALSDDAWAAALAGQRFEDSARAAPPMALVTLRPGPARTNGSSMAYL